MDRDQGRGGDCGDPQRRLHAPVGHRRRPRRSPLAGLLDQPVAGMDDHRLDCRAGHVAANPAACHQRLTAASPRLLSRSFSNHFTAPITSEIKTPRAMTGHQAINGSGALPKTPFMNGT